jgi:poly(hydroxyalkanoate) granule-associated protein
MSDKPHSPGSGQPPEHESNNIWLAGLGALARAQAEGGRAFEALVKRGLEMQNRTQALAKERMAEAAEQMQAQMQQAISPQPWNRLGGIFEERVAQALASMGMPTARQLAELTGRVQALERAQGGQPRAAPRKTATRKTAARKTGTGRKAD